MPYKRKYVPKRKKNYRKRFKDSKINTKIERKISQISKKNDAKNRQLLVRISAYGTDNTNQQSSNFDFVRLPINSTSGDSASVGLDIADLTAVGGNPYNAANPKGNTTETNANFAKYFRFTKLQTFLQFYNDRPTPCKVRVSIIYIPNANAYTAAPLTSSGITTVLQPNQMNCGVKDLRNKGMFRENYLNSLTDYNNYKHTILASKQIKLPAARDGAKFYREVNLSKTFEGLGKRFVYNEGTSPSVFAHMSNGNIYCVIAHNRNNTYNDGDQNYAPWVRGIAGAQYYIEKASTQSWN